MIAVSASTSTPSTREKGSSLSSPESTKTSTRRAINTVGGWGVVDEMISFTNIPQSFRRITPHKTRMSRFLKELDKTGKQNAMKKMTAAHTRQCNFPQKCTHSQYSQAYSWHIMRYIVATTHAMSWSSLTVAEKLNRYSDFWLTMLFSCGRTREITGIKNSHASFIARRRTNCFI